MQEENLSILRTLKQNIEEMTAPLEAAQLETRAENKENVQSGLDFIMGELTMIVLLLTGTDSEVAPREVELLNDMRHVVYGHGIPELSSGDYLELCREFLRVHPETRMTVDHLPSSVRLLLAYDQAHGTEYGSKARTLFVQFAEALVKADKNEHPIEAIILANFKDILNTAGALNW
jgi:hypothetical protein